MRRLLLLILLLLATMPLMAQNFLARSEVGLIGGGMAATPTSSCGAISASAPQ